MRHLATTRAAAHLLSLGLPIERKEDAVALLVKSVEDNNAAVALRLKAIENSDKGQGAKLAEIEAIILEIEQKMVRRGGGGERVAPETWGEQFVQSADLKSFAENTSRPGRLRLDVKTTVTTAAGSGGAIITPYRDGTVMMPKRRLVVRDLLPVVGISSGSVEYPKQTTRTNAADMVAETIQKPESEYAFSLQTATARVIAHWIPASRQVLEDAPQLAGLIDSELRYGLALKEEAQLLNGSGTGQNLLGMVTQAPAYVAPFAMTSPTMIDQLGLAVLQVALADFDPDGIIMHPSDWLRIRLMKDGQGKYLLGDPQGTLTPQLWGLPVVTTTAMAVDKFLVGSFQAAGTIYDRWAPRVEVSTEHADFFTRNLVAILAEERLAFAVKQAAALVYGDFNNVP